MCGICGIYDPEATGPPDTELLDTATDLMTHRGPDGRGTWLDNGIGLGHRRLAVIDPEGSHQPMVSGDGRLVIVYNGELYNFKTLRRELETEGVHFRTRGDTEVVLEALTRWWTAALERFEGMFALAVWDRQARKLLLARDRLGIKPLFYAADEGRLLFASEFAPLLAYPRITTAPDPLGIAGYLAHYQLTFDGHTIYSDIRSLEPGQYLVCDPKSREPQTRRYWSLPLLPSSEKEDNWPGKRLPEAAEELASLTREAVQSHMIADVPIGAFLSGGIDSAVVITLMSELSGERVRAYSIGFEEAGFSEFEYSVPLVEELGLQHRLLKLDRQEYFPLLEELIRHKRAPLSTPNEVPLLALSRHLSQDIKVVLSGEGADELLGGYGPLLRSPHDLLSAEMLRKDPAAMTPQLRQNIRHALKRQYGKSGFKDTLDHFLTVYSWLDPTDRSMVLNPEFVGPETDRNIERFWRNRLEHMQGLDTYDRYLYLLETEHLRGLLTRLDADTMAASVEGRVPFCDNRLMDFAWQLPFNFKLRWKSSRHRQAALGLSSLEIAEKFDIPKFVLKEAFRGRLPEAILRRQKQAFPVPLENWFIGEDQPDLIRRLEDNPGLGRYLNLSTIPQWTSATLASGVGAMKVWMVLNLIIWLETLE